MSITDRLDEIQALAAAATEGPWEPYRTENWEYDNYVTRTDLRSVAMQYALVWKPGDAEFIAHARTDVPALVAALRAVLALHFDDGGVCGDCYQQDDYAPYLMDYPCPTVRVVSAALGVPR